MCNKLLLKIEMSKIKHFFNLPKTVWGLSIVSMLSNSSSVIISSLSTTLVTCVLGGSASDLGYIRGATEAVGYLFKLFSGVISDCIGKRKILILIGYIAACLAKPIYATAQSLIIYFSAQLIDRVTNGLRDAPRDALISDASPKASKGSAFGLRQGLAALGSTVGAVAAFYLMYKLGGTSEHMVRGAYWFSIIPIVCAIIILFCMTKDPENIPQLSKRKGFPIKKSDLSLLGKNFWFFMFVVLIFMCSRSSEAFLTLRAQTVGLTTMYHPLVLAVLYLFVFLCAKLVGTAADKTSKKMFLIFGVLLAVVSYICLAYASTVFSLFVSVAIYGIQFGITQTVLFALVSEFAPKHIKATSFGILNLICAIGMCVSSFTQGHLWDKFGPETTYLVATCISVVSLILLFFIKPSNYEADHESSDVLNTNDSSVQAS